MSVGATSTNPASASVPPKGADGRLQGACTRFAGRASTGRLLTSGRQHTVPPAPDGGSARCLRTDRRAGGCKDVMRLEKTTPQQALRGAGVAAIGGSPCGRAAQQKTTGPRRRLAGGARAARAGWTAEVSTPHRPCSRIGRW